MDLWTYVALFTTVAGHGNCGAQLHQRGAMTSAMTWAPLSLASKQTTATISAAYHSTLSQRYPNPSLALTNRLHIKNIISSYQYISLLYPQRKAFSSPSPPLRRGYATVTVGLHCTYLLKPRVLQDDI